MVIILPGKRGIWHGDSCRPWFKSKCPGSRRPLLSATVSRRQKKEPNSSQFTFRLPPPPSQSSSAASSLLSWSLPSRIPSVPCTLCHHRYRRRQITLSYSFVFLFFCNWQSIVANYDDQAAHGIGCQHSEFRIDTHWYHVAHESGFGFVCLFAVRVEGTLLTAQLLQLPSSSQPERPSNASI